MPTVSLRNMLLIDMATENAISLIHIKEIYNYKHSFQPYTIHDILYF